MTGIRAALAALDAAGVPHCVRNGGRDVDALSPGEGLSVLVSRSGLDTAHRALLGAGLHRLPASSAPGTRAYVGFDGDWHRIDVVSQLRCDAERLQVEPLIAQRELVGGVWVVAPQDEQEHRGQRQVGQCEPPSLGRRLARKPAGLRRRGPVVAVLGPDGAGKGSTLAGAQSRLPVSVRVIYLGNQRPARRPETAAARTAGSPALAREAIFLLRKALPIWSQLVRVYAASWGGHIVLCDRHPIEVLAVRPHRTRTGAALERLLFAHIPPRPDRIVVLDAPGAVLHARKGEHDPETLERWRQGYLRSFVPPGAVVATTGSLELSVTGLLAVLWQETCRRNRWPLPDARPGEGP